MDLFSRVHLFMLPTDWSNVAVQNNCRQDEKKTIDLGN